MNKTLIMALASTSLALVGCQGGAGSSSSESSVPDSSADATGSSSEIKGEIDTSKVTLITPIGIPTLAFYDLGDEDDRWFSTSSPSDFIPAAFSSGQYDFIVFDGIKGLANVTNNKRDYALARWISGGTYYLVSTKYDSPEDLGIDKTIDSFVQNGVANQAFMNLAEGHWGIEGLSESGLVKYESGVEMVAQNLISSPEAYDFYLVAQPALTNAKAQLSAKGVELNIIYNLQDEWKEAHGEDATIPAAGLFVNKTAYGENKDVMDAFIAETEERMANAVENPELAVEALTAYEALDPNSDSDCSARFGFTPALVSMLQKDGANQFNIQSEYADPMEVANAFQQIVGGAEYPESSFLSR